MGSNDIFAYTHRIHGTGIYTYIYHKNQPNVGKYTGPMGLFPYIRVVLGG